MYLFIETLFLGFKAKSLGEHEWRSQQLGVLGGHHFESDTEMSDIDDDDRETLFSSMDLLSPGGHSDAQTLAMMLQEQLDAINKEIRCVGKSGANKSRKSLGRQIDLLLINFCVTMLANDANPRQQFSIISGAVFSC